MLLFNLVLLLTGATATPSSGAVRYPHSLARPNDYDHCYTHEVVPVEEYKECLEELLEKPKVKDCGAIRDKPNRVCKRTSLQLTMYNVNRTYVPIPCKFVSTALKAFDENGTYPHCAAPEGCLSQARYVDMRHGFRSFPVLAESLLIGVVLSIDNATYPGLQIQASPVEKQKNCSLTR